jgi:hypothetical protein
MIIMIVAEKVSYTPNEWAKLHKPYNNCIYLLFVLIAFLVHKCSMLFIYLQMVYP